MRDNFLKIKDDDQAKKKQKAKIIVREDQLMIIFFKFCLQKNYCHYKLIMTDILIVVGDLKSDENPTDRYYSNILSVLQTNNISCARVDNQTIQFIIPFSLLKQSAQIAPFYDYFYLGTISYACKVFSIAANAYSSEGIQVKASSLHQKTFLTKFAMNLNQKNQYFQIKVNPITGQIQVQSSYLINNQSYISQVVYQCLNNFRNQSNITAKILNALQENCLSSEKNLIFDRMIEKFESLRTLVLGSFEPVLQNQTEAERCHKSTFFVNENSNIILNKSANLNLIQKMKKTYVEGFMNMFVHSSTKMKLQNFTYLAFDQTPILKSLINSIQQSDYLPHGTVVEESFSVEGKKICLQLNSLRTESINHQYSILDKISKKKIYLSFLKEYIIARNYLQITNHYLVTKKQPFQLESVYKFVRKNKISLSLETKLKIISQIVCIACICLQRLENFQPDLSLNNFYIDPNFQFKLKSIGRAEVEPKDTLTQVLFKLLYDKNYFQTKQKKVYKNHVITIQDSNMKYFGPTFIMKIMLRVISNYEKSSNKGSEKPLENMLLVINRISDLFQKILEGFDQNLQF